MRYKLIFGFAFVGVVAALAAGYLFSIETPAQSPAFNPAQNPYTQGIYAEGIVESLQSSGENVSIYPEVGGTVKEIFVSEGQTVRKGAPLLQIDDSVQSATTAQLQSQSEAALSMLEELRAQPRRENLSVAEAQVVAAQANLKTALDTFDKLQTAYEMNNKSVSMDALDSATNAAAVAKANLEVAKRQYDLTKAGAWSYDIKNQENQYNAAQKSYLASSALLAKYMLRAPKDGIVLSISATPGSYVSPQGAYDTYTGGADPVITLGSPQEFLSVRCYVDEILVPKIPPPSQIRAEMSIRGSNVKLPMDYVRVQPFVSPKIQLSDQRTERVDVRVLPIIFKVRKPPDVNLYPGQLVDVYIGH